MASPEVNASSTSGFFMLLYYREYPYFGTKGRWYLTPPSLLNLLCPNDVLIRKQFYINVKRTITRFFQFVDYDINR